MAPFTPIRRQSLAEAVFEQLRDSIVAGEVAVGDTLPAERVLADELGVNRQAVREGLKRLEQAGLVTVRQGGGTKVLDYRQSAGLELLGSLVVGPRGLQTGVVRSILSLRRTLGPEVARACAERGGAAASERLVARWQAMASTHDTSARQELALRFWGDVVKGADQVAYQLAFHALDRSYRVVMDELTELLHDEVSDLDAYKAIARAVAAGDGDAAAVAAGQLLDRGTAAVEALLVAVDAARESS